ncbi:MAG: protein phosphatase CheZ [Pseudolabrys sp.]|nr:protein phosphatase CheZ [Pseudolabrys sp.]
MQRKVFRIEQMMAAKRPTVSPAGPADRRRMNDEIKSLRTQLHRQTQDHNGAQSYGEQDSGEQGHDGQHLRAELAHVRDALAQHQRDLGSLIGDGQQRHMARAVDELSAAAGGMKMAADKILKSVEVIDEGAKALPATLQDDYKRGLAQDIQEQVVEIFESCNFQDLAGQRIGKVAATLTAVENQVAAMLAGCDGAGATDKAATPAHGNGLINGPKLDGDAGHASQRDIDMMFG